MLERAAVPLTHQIANQARGPFCISIDILDAGLTDRRYTGSEDDVSILSAGSDEFHCYVTAELDVLAGSTHGAVGFKGVGQARHVPNPTRERLRR